MCNLILMMGIPGSGKTTIAKKLFNSHRDCYISRDEVRFSIISDEEEYFSKENQVFAEFVKRINDAILTTPRFVVADATHLNMKSRHKLLSQIKNKIDGIYIIYVDVPINTALDRNNYREGRSKVPETAIRNMWNSIQFPQVNEGIDGVFVFNENGLLDIEKTIFF